MRNLFFALVLANLAFAAWQAWFAAEDPVRERPTDADSAAIRLVTEVEPDDGALSPRGDPIPEAGGAGAAADLARRDTGTAVRPDAAGIDPPNLDLAPRIAAPSLGARAMGSAPNSGERDADPAAAPSVPATESAAEAPALRGGATAAASAPASDRCVSVGPFLEPSEADDAAERLRASGLDPAPPRAAEGDIGISYWVHLDAIPTRAEANEMLSTLRENGVADAYLIPGEEDGDIISLGVFNDVVRANRLRDQIRPIGLEPLVVDRPRRGTVYWVDVALRAGRQLEFEALRTPGRIMRLEQRPCEAPDA